MSFETSAELSLTVDEGDLQNVKQQIESEIGTTAVGVTDGGSMSAQSAGSSGGGRGRRARRSMRLAETRTELLEDAVVYLEGIEDKVGGGGGGGVGGIFTELFGSATETAGDAAIEAGDTVAEALTDVLTGTAASALGNTISSAITGSEVAVEDTTLTVRRPDWLDDVGRRFDPDVDLDIPDTIAVERDPLPVQRDVLPVEREPLPVEDVGPISVTVSGRTSQEPTSKTRGSGDSTRVQLGGDNGISIGRRGVQVGGDSGITIGRDPTASSSSQSGNGARPTATSARDVTVTHTPTYRVDVDPRRLDSLADRIVSDIEENVQRDIEELDRKLEDLESDLNDLEREITRP